VAAVRDLRAPDALLQVDSNAANSLLDLDHSRHLDDDNLLLIEQPFTELALDAIARDATPSPLCCVTVDSPCRTACPPARSAA